MKNIFKIFTAAVLFLTGCAAPSTPTSVSDDPPVRYARYVQVATYDATPRPPTKKLTILQQAPNGTYPTIATLTINGKLEDEAKLINALAWKARQLGADALLRLPPTGDKRYNGLGVPQATHWVFRADAFVVDTENSLQKNPGKLACAQAGRGVETWSFRRRRWINHSLMEKQATTRGTAHIVITNHQPRDRR